MCNKGTMEGNERSRSKVIPEHEDENLSEFLRQVDKRIEDAWQGLVLMERASMADLMFMAHHGQVGWHDGAWAQLDRLLRDGERRQVTHGTGKKRRADVGTTSEAQTDLLGRTPEAVKKANREVNAAVLEQYVKEQLVLQNGDRGQCSTLTVRAEDEEKQTRRCENCKDECDNARERPCNTASTCSDLHGWARRVT